MKIWRPFTQMHTALTPLRVKTAKDALLTLDNGNEIIDAISSWWVITHGHCQKEIVSAVQEQSKEIDQVLFANFSHNSAEKLVSGLSEILPSSLSKVFFSDNGSTAVEVALKMLIQYWRHKEAPQRKVFLSFDHSYHGDTVGAMSVSGDSVFTRTYSDLLFYVKKLQQGRYSTDSIDSFVSPVEEALSKQANEIAGIIIEPLVQGAGGMIIWPKEALERISALSKKYNIPLIFDEVMTGFGRTGKLFAFQHLDFVPDIICLSKGLTGGMLPLSLTIATEEIYNAFLDDDKSKMFFHGHSFTGNPISCAAAAANLEIIKTRDMQLKWDLISSIHQERIKKYYSDIRIKDARLCGTIAAIEVDEGELGYTSKLSEKLTAFCLERGVFLRPLGNVIYILPPYSITPEQLHQVWDAIDSGIKTLLN